MMDCCDDNWPLGGGNFYDLACQEPSDDSGQLEVNSIRLPGNHSRH